MTLEELQAIAQDTLLKTQALRDASQNLNDFVAAVWDDVKPTNPLSAAINVDTYVAIQTPIYVAHLTAIETATDALGTDPFH